MQPSVWPLRSSVETIAKDIAGEFSLQSGDASVYDDRDQVDLRKPNLALHPIPKLVAAAPA